MISIRSITMEDSAAAANLADELGYPVSPEVMAERIADLTQTSGRAVFVACHEGAVVGWIDLSTEKHMQTEPKARIDGLIVSESARGKGVGAMLCRRAEEWALEQGLKKIMLTSRSTRERAHAFYERDGYVRTKTSYLFEKSL